MLRGSVTPARGAALRLGPKMEHLDRRDESDRPLLVQVLHTLVFVEPVEGVRRDRAPSAVDRHDGVV
jgi:hypothetical protein